MSSLQDSLLHRPGAIILPLCVCRCPQCLEVLVTLRRELERRQLLRVPLVYVSPALGPETQRLREYVRRLQANLAERPGGQGAAGGR